MKLRFLSNLSTKLEALEEQLSPSPAKPAEAALEIDGATKRPINTPSKQLGPSPNVAPQKKTRMEPGLSPLKPLALAYTPDRGEDAQRQYPLSPPSTIQRRVEERRAQAVAVVDPYADTYVEAGADGEVAECYVVDDESVKDVLVKAGLASESIAMLISKAFSGPC